MNPREVVIASAQPKPDFAGRMEAAGIEPAQGSRRAGRFIVYAVIDDTISAIGPARRSVGATL
jgi:hypothetical protein